MNILHRVRTISIAACTLALMSLSRPVLAGAGNYWQWVNPLPQGNLLNAVAWNGSNTYVAVGNGGTVLTSPDAQTWTVRTPGTKKGFVTVAWGGGTFVAADYTGMIWTSPDGVTWTSHLTGSTYSVASIVWNGSKFVAVGSGGLILTSADGATWTTQVAGASSQGSLNRVIWNGTQFVAVGDYGMILTSPDGVTWTARSSGTTAQLIDVAWSGAGFVAISYNLSITSPDGVTWTTHTQNNFSLRHVVWGNGEFLAVTNNAAVTSADGVTWNTSYAGPPRSFYGLLWDGSAFLAVGDGGSIYRTVNGSSWTAETQDILASLNRYMPDLTGVAWNGTDFVVVSSWGAVLTSADGLNWTVTTLGTTHNLKGVACANGLCVAVGTNGDIETSPDGVVWTAQTSGTTNTLDAITWDGVQYVTVGLRGTILTSPGGVTWTARTSGTTYELLGVASGGGQLVAVGKGSTILTSPDGVAWTSQNSGVISGTEQFMSVAYGASKFVVNTLFDGVLSSPDGVTWNSDSTLNHLDSLSRAGSWFVASGSTVSVSDESVFTSSDGVSWSPQVSRISYGASPNAFAWNQNPQASVYVGVGLDSGIIASIAPTPGGLQAVTATQPNSVNEDFTLNGTGALTVTASSSDQTLLPDANISGASGCTAAGSCSLTLQPVADQTGTATVTVTVNDSYGQSGSGTFQVTVNPPPVPAVSGFSGNTITQPNSGSEAFTVSGTGALTVTASSSDQTLLPNANITGASSCTAAGNCSLTLQPAADKTGTATVTVSVSDAYGQSATGTFQVTVNAPAAPAESGFSNLTVKGSGGSETFTIAGTGALAVSAASSDQHLLPDANITGASSCTAAGSCTLTLTPAANQSGTATVTVSLTDAYGQSATGSFDVTVQAASGGGGSSGSGSSGGGGSFGAWTVAGLLLFVLIPWFFRGRRQQSDHVSAGMQVIRGRHYLLIALVITQVCLSCLAQAKPLAPKLQVTKKGKILNYGFEGPCPDAKAVGIPAYPGSVCYGRGAPNKTSRIVYLMTSADAATVAAWYAKRLTGWKRSEIKLLGEVDFKPPHKKKTAEQRRENLEEHWGEGPIGPSVTVRRMRTEDVREKKMFYAFHGTPATTIEIDYVVSESRK